MVVRSRDSRQLQVLEAPEQALDRRECPYCHRPYLEAFQSESAFQHVRSDFAYDGESQYVHPNYFAMLAESQRPSPASSTRSSSPDYNLSHAGSGFRKSRESTSQPDVSRERTRDQPNRSVPAGGGISSSAFNPGFFKRNLRPIRELGRGGNGVVLLVEHHLGPKFLGEFACKRVPVGDNHAWLEKVLTEVTFLRRIRHRNLVTCHWVWLEDHKPSNFAPTVPHLFMLQDYCDKGDLHDYVVRYESSNEFKASMEKQSARATSQGETELRRGSNKLGFDEMFSFFRDITSGLHELHCHGLMHRDLKPSNCLLKEEGNRLTVLISDFGEIQPSGQKRHSTGATGTISYCAPEVLQLDVTSGQFGEFTFKSDIFSLGMIVYFMCFGRLPYSNADDINAEREDLYQLRAEISKWKGLDDRAHNRAELPDQLYKYLKSLLSVDPSERPSTGEILAKISSGSGLNDVVLPIVEDHNGRASAGSSQPLRRSSHRQKPPALRRPTIPAVRQKSIDATSPRSASIQHDRSPTSSPNNSRPTSPVDSAVIVRPRKIELPPEKDTVPPQQSPRLLLPPPPPAHSTSLSGQPKPQQLTLKVLRTLLFAFKALSLMLPCSPFAPNAWLLYSLLAIALLELSAANMAKYRVAILLGLHVSIIVLAYRGNRLCEGQALRWNLTQDWD